MVHLVLGTQPIDTVILNLLMTQGLRRAVKLDLVVTQAARVPQARIQLERISTEPDRHGEVHSGTE